METKDFWQRRSQKTSLWNHSPEISSRGRVQSVLRSLLSVVLYWHSDWFAARSDKCALRGKAKRSFPRSRLPPAERNASLVQRGAR